MSEMKNGIEGEASLFLGLVLLYASQPYSILLNDDLQVLMF